MRAHLAGGLDARGDARGGGVARRGARAALRASGEPRRRQAALHALPRARAAVVRMRDVRCGLEKEGESATRYTNTCESRQFG